jgi:hypothetical protein
MRFLGVLVFLMLGLGVCQAAPELHPALKKPEAIAIQAGRPLEKTFPQASKTVSEPITLKTDGDNPLDLVLEQNEARHSRYTSSAFGLKVLFLLTLLLGGFAAIVKWVLPYLRSQQENQLDSLTPAPLKEESVLTAPKGFLSWIPSRLKPTTEAPKIHVLSKTALDSNKALYVVACAGKQFMIGATASQINLMGELPSTGSDTETTLLSREDRAIFKKYLALKTRNPKNQALHPSDLQEEVTVLEDYQDSF